MNLIADSTFNQVNLEEIIKELDDWKFLGFLIGDRNSQDNFEMFCSGNKNAGQETCVMLREWQDMNPYASWILLYQALKTMNETEISEDIQSTYLSG